MKEILLTEEKMDVFLQWLQEEKKRTAETIQEYRHTLVQFRAFLSPDFLIRQDSLIRWQQEMEKEGILAKRTVNRRTSAVNAFLSYLGERNWQAPLLIVDQQKSDARLTRSEYLRLLQAAKVQGKERIYFMMKVLCILGLQVREMPQLTVELVKAGHGDIGDRSRKRMLRLPKSLQTELLDFCRRQGLRTGPIFVTRNGNQLHRTSVNLSMKQLCEDARVAQEKATPRCLHELYEQTQQELRENVTILLLQNYEKMLEAENVLTAWEVEQKGG